MPRVGLDVVELLAVDESPLFIEHATIEERLGLVHLPPALIRELRMLREMDASVRPSVLVAQQRHEAATVKLDRLRQL